MIDRLLAATWRSKRVDPMLSEVGRAIDNVVLYRLMQLASNAEGEEQARAIAFAKLENLRTWMTRANPADPLQRAHFRFAAQEIEYFSKNPKDIRLPKPADPPDGPPIGSDGEW